jgi:hypothetical protein
LPRLVPPQWYRVPSANWTGWAGGCVLLIGALVGLRGGRDEGAVSRSVGVFTVTGSDIDRQAVGDVAAALGRHSPSVCADLRYEYRSRVLVTVYPSPTALDQHGMNPAMRGYRAYSGGGRIEMVTPREPLRIGGTAVPYEERVLIAVHEFVHLVNDEVNPGMPAWLDEGLACFVGPHAIYAYVCQHQFPFSQVPTFPRLEESYRSVPGADLFAYSLLDFVCARAGRPSLARLARSPERLLEILRVRDRAELELRWKEHRRKSYVG